MIAALVLAVAIPSQAAHYRRALTSSVRLVWGLDGPIATMAGQVHQESGWDTTAHSVYAGGLAQFTPATATWISRRYPDLAANQPYEPAWALLALAHYDRDLYLGMPEGPTCDRWAFTLSAYNGGAGWIARDRKLAMAAGADSTRWWGNVERFTSRSKAAARENRGYPRRILLRLQAIYTAWGPSISCRGVV